MTGPVLKMEQMEGETMREEISPTKLFLLKQSRFVRMVSVLALVSSTLLVLTVTALCYLIIVKPEQSPQRSVIENSSSSMTSNTNLNRPQERPAPSWPVPSGSLLGKFKRAAVATDEGVCSNVGREILILGGNAADASIAALLCLGVVQPQSSGLGGGFLMTLFNGWVTLIL
ncbi:hypothetical protein AB6A40_006338 [Gnathostoma spinigerum]|uniref:Uncharacterized protein n=1 Tax=Gnathostoma spinigerum TaxID=75299 RepID=A0ABD6ENB0_9BILA